MIDEVTDEELKAELYRSLKEKNCDRFLHLLEEAKKGLKNQNKNLYMFNLCISKISCNKVLKHKKSFTVMSIQLSIIHM